MTTADRMMPIAKTTAVTLLLTGGRGLGSGAGFIGRGATGLGAGATTGVGRGFAAATGAFARGAATVLATTAGGRSGVFFSMLRFGAGAAFLAETGVRGLARRFFDAPAILPLSSFGICQQFTPKMAASPP